MAVVNKNEREAEMATIDQQFIEYIIKQLVTEPDAVRVERKIDEKGVLLELTVSPEDIGRIIGKRGSTAQSLRNLLRALGSKNNARYNLKIVDVDRPQTDKPTGETASEPEAPAKTEPATDLEAAEIPEVEPETDDSTQPVEETSPEAVENTSELTEKTRKELADLDDLDI
jgi:predicted RNA-binding protein YlqC (UPF0109 family)